MCFDICRSESNELGGKENLIKNPSDITMWSRNVREIIYMSVCLVFNLSQLVGGPMAIKSMAKVNSNSTFTPRICGECDVAELHAVFLSLEICWDPSAPLALLSNFALQVTGK